MTDTPTTLPVDKLEPSPNNLRRRPKDGAAFKELVASIKAVGVLEPLLVCPNGGEKYLIVAGERRWTAAQEAGLSEVPVSVREMTEAEQTEVMLIENLQRSDLNPTEEAVGYLRLVDLGMSKKDLAARIGRSAAHVSDRIRLLDLPAKAQKLVDSGEVSIHAAGELLKLPSREDMLEVVASKPYDYVQAVGQRLRAAAADKAIAKAREIADKSGYPVIEVDNYSLPGNEKTTAIGTGWGDLNVDKKAHREEECHALAILTRAGKCIEVCTDPKRHAAKGKSEVKVPEGAKAGRALSESEKKQRAEQKAEAERKKARREEMAEFLRHKLPAGAAEVALRCFILDANHTRQVAVCKMLDIEVDKGEYRTETEGPLLAYMDGPTKVTRAALALAFVLLDDTWANGELAGYLGAWVAENVGPVD